MHLTSRTGLLSAGLLFISALLMIGGCAGSASPGPAPANNGGIATGPRSHVHTLVINSDGSVTLGDQDGLWHAASGAKGWKRDGAPMSRLMPICLARVNKVMVACSTGLSTNVFGKPKGLWRSTDGGRHWKRASLPDLDVTALASNPAVPGTVVAFARPDSLKGIGHGGIWASVDSGVTWRRINTSVAHKAPNGMVLMPGHPFTVLFATTVEIDRSANGGVSWTSNHLGGNAVLSIAASPIRGHVGYIGAANGIWMTTDSGAQWTLRWSGPPTPLLAPTRRSLGVLYGYASTGRPYIYETSASSRSISGGVHHPTPVSFSQPAILVADPSDASRLYAAYSFPLRIYESKDAGRSWKKIL